MLAFVVVGNLSFAEENSKSNSPHGVTDEKVTLNHLVDFWKSYGVSQSTIQKLVKKWNNGLAIDALKGDDSQGTATIQTYGKLDPISGNNQKVTKKVYPDGSISVTTVEVPKTDNTNPNLISPLSVTGGTVTSGTGYTIHHGATVGTGNGAVTCSFKADFENINGAYDLIDRIYSYDIVVWGGSYSDVELKLVRKYETSTYKAHGMLRFQAIIGPTGATQHLDLYVGKNTYYSSTNI
ncbi:hypothetical protein GMB86_07730 [Terrilactibacillus sp. BCM23-1]|uniref:Uncharacterized protein n=1 Tax=Terrilactibacillus tamarindi TaxID=2599694 RepID=A0A6N8CRS2_9BACI|nr:hypothetical protein [Terrilactibacillus tamarindi]MTT31897.1 hypothetical protein [Terrilactibacillus tamarindi]